MLRISIFFVSYHYIVRTKVNCSPFQVIWFKIMDKTVFYCLFEIRKIAVCFLWLSLPGDCRVTDEALLAETT